jgi:hypothetical protein
MVQTRAGALRGAIVSTHRDPDPPESPAHDDGPFDLGSLEVLDERPAHGLSDDRRGAKIVAVAIAGGAIVLSFAVALIRSGPNGTSTARETTLEHAVVEHSAEAVVQDDAPSVPEPPAPEVVEEVAHAAIVFPPPEPEPEPSPEPSPGAILPRSEVDAQPSRTEPSLAEATPAPAVGTVEQPFADLPSIDAAVDEAEAASEPDDATPEADALGGAESLDGPKTEPDEPEIPASGASDDDESRA